MSTERSLRASTSKIDKIIGGNLRTIRLKEGLSQIALAEQLGCSFQQLQKYERGTNRIGSGTLFLLSDILKTPIPSFYEGVAKGVKPKEINGVPSDIKRREILIIQKLARIKDAKLKASIARIIESISS